MLPLVVFALTMVSAPDLTTMNAVFFGIGFMVVSFWQFLADAVPAAMRLNASISGPGMGFLVLCFYQSVLYFNLMSVDYTKMFRFGHISIAASGVAANSMMNILVFFARNIYTVLTDRESMVVLNSATTTMQMTRGQYMVLAAMHKLVTEEADTITIEKKILVRESKKSRRISGKESSRVIVVPADVV